MRSSFPGFSDPSSRPMVRPSSISDPGFGLGFPDPENPSPRPRPRMSYGPGFTTDPEPDLGFLEPMPRPMQEPRPRPGFEFDGPDFSPDFSEKIDVVADSINLALNTLDLSKSEYNTMSMQELKSLRRIDTCGTNTCALNILIHYKKLQISQSRSLNLMRQDNIMFDEHAFP